MSHGTLKNSTGRTCACQYDKHTISFTFPPYEVWFRQNGRQMISELMNIQACTLPNLIPFSLIYFHLPHFLARFPIHMCDEGNGNLCSSSVTFSKCRVCDILHLTSPHLTPPHLTSPHLTSLTEHQISSH
jgi:hypothetical protein